jgi:hypothetical protein
MLDLINKLIALNIPTYAHLSRDEQIVIFTLALQGLVDQSKQEESAFEASFALSVIGAFAEEDLTLKRLELERRFRPLPPPE